jgi:hypothetical protein
MRPLQRIRKIYRCAISRAINSLFWMMRHSFRQSLARFKSSINASFILRFVAPIRLNPAATKGSSNLKDVPSPAVQPNMFHRTAAEPPPILNYPSCVFSFGHCTSELHESLDQKAGELDSECISHADATRCSKSWSILKEGLRILSFAQVVLD